MANGLEPKVLSDIMSKSSGRNWALECITLAGVMENAPASRGYSGGFGSDLMLKDLGLAQEAALHARAATPLARRRAICTSCTARTARAGWIFQHRATDERQGQARTGLSRYCIFPVTALRGIGRTRACRA